MEKKSQSDLLDLLRPLEEQLELLLPKPIKVEVVHPLEKARKEYARLKKECDDHWAYMRTFPVEYRFTSGLLSAGWPTTQEKLAAEARLAKLTEEHRGKSR